MFNGPYGRRVTSFSAAALLTLSAWLPGVSRADTVASLLGNFTINQFCGLKLGGDTLNVHFVVVFGQLPALRELHLADSDGNGITTQSERDAYLGTLAPEFAHDLKLFVDGVAVPLRPTSWTSSLPTEQGGFSLRVDMDLLAALPAAGSSPRRIEFANDNYAGRLGWHEIVVEPAQGLSVFATNAFSTSLTNGLRDALQALPASGPLDEREIHLDFTAASAASDAPHPRPLAARSPIEGVAAASVAGASAAGATAAAGKADAGFDMAWIAHRTRQLVDAISGPAVEPHVAMLVLLGAVLLGAVHALSPGHGKTIVGAYLIGSRGTPRHAVFLGLTVTITHTLGVFALGFATLYASRFIVPERLFPILSLLSAVLVLGMGIVLLIQRGGAAREALAAARSGALSAFRPVAATASATGGTRGYVFAPSMHSVDGTLHSHGGGPMHSHLPPGAKGEQVTWRSLLALGISGGLVPCPSAMVLLLAAVALNKTAYGMLLVVAFSVGLAMTLTLVGLAFLYARNRFSRPSTGSRWARLLPVMSAGTITVLGLVLCVGAVKTFL